MTARTPDQMRVDGVRSTGVWGGVMAGVSAGAILFFLLYGYYYLDLSNEPFVPERIGPPPVLVPALLVAALAATAVPATWALRAAVHGASGRIAGSLAVVAAVGTAVLAVGALVMWDQGLTPTQDAYSASVVLVLGYHGLATVTGVIMAAYVAASAVRMADHPWLLSAATVTVVWWAYVVLGWLAVGFSVFVYPQLAPGAT